MVSSSSSCININEVEGKYKKEKLIEYQSQQIQRMIKNKLKT